MFEIILVSLGAILGANTRFIIYRKLEKITLSNNSIILLINTLSSFALGLILSLFSQMSTSSYAYELGLFFAIGLLGSLSTFSTFVYHLYTLFVQLKFYRAFRFFIISLISGILSFSFGYLLGMQ